MPTRIFASATFDKFARKEGIGDAKLVEAIVRVENGLVDANLGGGLLKIRVARPGQGKRDGYRTIVACKVGERAVFLIGYGKNDMGNIGEATTMALRTLAKNLQALTEEGLEYEKAGGRLREIER